MRNSFSVTLLLEDPTLDQPLNGTGGRLTIWEDQGQVGVHQPDTPFGTPVLNDVDPMNPKRLPDGAFPLAALINDTAVLAVPPQAVEAMNAAERSKNLFALWTLATATIANLS